MKSAAVKNEALPVTRLYLVRHGQSVANVKKRLQGQTHGELTTTGKKEIIALAERVSNFNIDHLISSDLRRAYETAEAVAKRSNLEFSTIPDVREWNIGVLDGKPHHAWVEIRNTSDIAEELITPQGGESLNDLRDRTHAFLENMVKRYDGQTIMVVCHGDFIRACLRILLGLSFSEASAYRPQNASYTILERHQQEDWTLKAFSIDEHLKEIY